MGLWERLLNVEQPRLPSHQFSSAMAEVARGQLTKNQVVNGLNLSAGEATELNALASRFTGGFLTRQEFEDVVLLAQYGVPSYQSVAAIKSRFGV